MIAKVLERTAATVRYRGSMYNAVAQSVLFPTASNISTGFVRPPPNRCYCRQSSALGMRKPPTVLVSPQLS